MTSTSAVAVRQHSAARPTGGPQRPKDLHPPHAGGSSPFTIVHISDPHISRQHYREHIKSFKLLLKFLNAFAETFDGASLLNPGEQFPFVKREERFDSRMVPAPSATTLCVS